MKKGIMETIDFVLNMEHQKIDVRKELTQSFKNYELHFLNIFDLQNIYENEIYNKDELEKQYITYLNNYLFCDVQEEILNLNILEIIKKEN